MPMIPTGSRDHCEVNVLATPQCGVATLIGMDDPNSGQPSQRWDSFL